ncbi:MAG TPA: hypothetical protein PLN21_02450 [Gemmatales bacterium]|nr:hypothetical protein [Gemmatales bacterium]
MQTLEVYVEQLDVAATLLNSSDTTSYRLALILTDNIVELLCHNACVHLFSKYNNFDFDTLAPVDRSKKEAALGQKLGPKIELHKHRGVITEDQASYCHAAHAIRNESYHTGVMQGEVLLPIAFEYHSIALALFERFFQRSVTIQWGKKHACLDKHMAGTAGLFPGSPEYIQAISTSLTSCRRPLGVRLQDALSKAITDRLDDMLETIEYIASGQNPKKTLDQEIYNIQYWNEFGKICPEEGFTLNSPEHLLFQNKMAQFHAEFRVKVSLKTIQSWRKRASLLTAEKSLGKALGKYMDLIRDFRGFEQFTSQSCSSFDMAVEMQMGR